MFLQSSKTLCLIEGQNRAFAKLVAVVSFLLKAGTTVAMMAGDQVQYEIAKLG